MTKIRRFKLELRPRELARRAKKAKLDPAAAGLPGEPDLAAFALRFQKSMEPAVVYQSFGPDHPRAPLAPVAGLGFSLGIATLGAGPEAFEAALLENREEAKAPLARLARELALEDAIQFVLGLLKQEADDEECDLSPVAPLHDAAALDAALQELQAGRIGVSTVDGRWNPLCTSAFSVSWIARPKSKKTARR
jgi:hypothetical protein